MIFKDFLLIHLTFCKCLKSVEKIVALNVRLCIEQQKTLSLFPSVGREKRKPKLPFSVSKIVFFTGLFEKKEYNASLFLMFLIKG